MRMGGMRRRVVVAIGTSDTVDRTIFYCGRQCGFKLCATHVKQVPFFLPTNSTNICEFPRLSAPPSPPLGGPIWILGTVRAVGETHGQMPVKVCVEIVEFSWPFVSPAAPKTKNDFQLGVAWETSLRVMQILDVRASKQQVCTTTALCLTLKRKNIGYQTNPEAMFYHRQIHANKQYELTITRREHNEVLSLIFTRVVAKITCTALAFPI